MLARKSGDPDFHSSWSKGRCGAPHPPIRIVAAITTAKAKLIDARELIIIFAPYDVAMRPNTYRISLCSKRHLVVRYRVRCKRFLIAISWRLMVGVAVTAHTWV